jgi:hypothetical protein
MQKYSALFLLIYYTFGSLCLPRGDFSLLTELPKMFEVCEKTEHQDMNIFEFVTEHLIDIGGMFDTHEQDDDQKAHKPFHFSHQAQSIMVVLPPSVEWTDIAISYIPIVLFENIKPITNKTFIPSHFLADIFRPPIV